MQVIAKRRIGGAIVWLVFGVLSAVFGAVTLATGLGTMSDLAKKIVGALSVSYTHLTLPTILRV